HDRTDEAAPGHRALAGLRDARITRCARPAPRDQRVVGSAAAARCRWRAGACGASRDHPAHARTGFATEAAPGLMRGSTMANRPNPMPSDWHLRESGDVARAHGVELHLGLHDDEV